MGLVLRKVEELERAGAKSVRAACISLLHTARAGLLPEALVTTLRSARDKRGRSSPDGLPSLSSLAFWVMRERRGDSLIPKKRRPDEEWQPWHFLALDLKQRPQKPTTQWVHDQLVKNWVTTLGEKPPSYDQVTYFFREKYSVTDLLEGQYQGSALAAKKSCVKRTTDGETPFAEVHADGWNTHFNAPHPVTGEFVTYELWHFHELVTRFVTKPAIGLSESQSVILVGLENYIIEMGVPHIWQTDSTNSVKNKTVEQDPWISVAARAGMGGGTTTEKAARRTRCWKRTSM